MEAKEEIAALAETINSMTDTSAARSPSRSPPWHAKWASTDALAVRPSPWRSRHLEGLTENVNQLAANLTTQVRAIAEVAVAVTKAT